MPVICIPIDIPKLDQFLVEKMIQYLWEKEGEKPLSEKEFGEVENSVWNYFNEIALEPMTEETIYSRSRFQQNFDRKFLNRARAIRLGQPPFNLLLYLVIRLLEKKLGSFNTISAYLAPYTPFGFTLIPSEYDPLWLDLFDRIYVQENEAPFSKEYVKSLNKRRSLAETFRLMPLDDFPYFPNRSNRKDALTLQIIGIPFEEFQRRNEAIQSALQKSGILPKPPLIIEKRRRPLRKKNPIEETVRNFYMTKQVVGNNRLLKRVWPESHAGETSVASKGEILFLKNYVMAESQTFFGMHYRFFYLLRKRYMPLLRKTLELKVLSEKEADFVQKFVAKLQYLKFINMGVQKPNLKNGCMENLQTAKYNPEKEIKESVSSSFSKLEVSKKNQEELAEALTYSNQEERYCENLDCRAPIDSTDPRVYLCSTCSLNDTIRKQVYRRLVKEGKQPPLDQMNSNDVSRKKVRQKRRTSKRFKNNDLNPPSASV